MQDDTFYGRSLGEAQPIRANEALGRTVFIVVMNGQFE